MTNRPTDDFDGYEDADNRPLNSPDEDDAAFGESASTRRQQNTADRFDETADELTDGAYDALAEDAPKQPDDDSAFVEDDMRDIAEDFDENELEQDQVGDTYDDPYESDNAGEVEYDVIEDDGDDEANRQQQATNGKDKRYLGKYKKSDLIFYGIIGVGGLIALVVALSTVFSSPAPRPAAAPSTQPIAVAENSAPTPTVPIDSAAPVATLETPAAALPIPDLPSANSGPIDPNLGIPGANSSFGPDLINPNLGQPVAEAPGAAPAAPLPFDAAAAIATPSAPAQAPAETPAPTASAQPAPAAFDEPLAPVAQVTAPPTLGVDNTAIAERVTELSTRLVQLNAQLTQITDNLNNLQKTTDALSKQSQELGTKVEQKTQQVETRIDELAKQKAELAQQPKNNETPNNAATLDELKISVAQLERRLANLGRGNAAANTTTSPQPAARAPQSFAGPPAPAAAPVTTAKANPPAPRQASAPQPSADTNVQDEEIAINPATGAAPRSPKSRDQAGAFFQTPQATWVLRAATPTMAWLSPRPGSAELKRVAPGDTLAGIGQVLEIRQESGRWQVIGTEGMVR